MMRILAMCDGWMRMEMIVESFPGLVGGGRRSAGGRRAPPTCGAPPLVASGVGIRTAGPLYIFGRRGVGAAADFISLTEYLLEQSRILVQESMP